VVKSYFNFLNVNRSFFSVAQLDVNCAILEMQRGLIERQLF
jgi:hypothetical protein